MEFAIERSELARHLGILISTVRGKIAIPILSNVKMDAVGDQVTLTATDLDVSLRVSLPAKVKSEGSLCVPARKLFDYAKLLDNGDINLKANENHWLSVSAGKSRSKMVGMDVAGFPVMSEFPASSIQIPANTLTSLISKTIYAVSEKEERYTLNGVLFVSSGEQMTVVATDGHRLAKASADADMPESRTLWPRAATILLSRLLDSESPETITQASDDAVLYFRVGKYELRARQLTGTFPNYEAIMPKGELFRVAVGRDEFSKALARVAQFSDERSHKVILRLQDGNMVIAAASTESGDAEESLEVGGTFDPMSIGFRAEYLSDVLGASDTDRMAFSFNGPNMAATMSPAAAGDVRYSCVIMPMRA